MLHADQPALAPRSDRPGPDPCRAASRGGRDREPSPAAGSRGAAGVAEEQRLLERVLDGEPGSFAELLERYRRTIFRCITRVLKRSGLPLPRAAADEVMSDLCLTLLRHDMRPLRAYDASRGARLGTWLGLLATNAARDYVRAQRRRPPTGGDDLLANRPADAPSPLARLLEGERRRRLRALAARLPPAERRVFHLLYNARLSPADAARRLGISVKAVYARKHRATRRLRALLRAGGAG